MEVTTTAVDVGKTQCLITNNGPDALLVGEYGQDSDNWFSVASGDAISVKGYNNGIGVVSVGVSDVGILIGGTGIFPPAVEIPEVDLSSYETISDHDSDLSALASAVAATYETQSAHGSSQAAAIAALSSVYQPLDSDLTAIAALSTTSFGRAVLALADAAALGAYVGAAVYGQAQGVNPQTGTSYTLVAADAGKRVTLSNAAAITLTLPQDSDATIAIGTYIDLIQLGAGQVTVVAGSGATLRTSGLTAKCRAQYARVGVQKILANTWSLFGDLAAT